MDLIKSVKVFWLLAILFFCTGLKAHSQTISVDPEKMVEAHNEWRSEVGVPPLEWSPELAEMAKEWANVLAQEDSKFRHSNREGFGENLFYASAKVWSDGRREIQEVTESEVVNSWAGEKKNYDYSENSCSGVCGHYTQIVWESTKEVGCAAALSGDKSQVWVCNYHPPGNIIGKRPY